VSILRPRLLARLACLALATGAWPAHAAPQVSPESTLGGNAATRPSAAHNGRWGIVTWADADKVQAQVVDAAGQPVGLPFRACSSRFCAGAEPDPAVAEPLKDTFPIVWQDDRNGVRAQDPSGPRLYPRDKFTGIQYPKEEARSHWHTWVDACLAAKKTSDGFHYAGPMAEAVQLGNVATRLAIPKIDPITGRMDEKQTPLEWDSANFRFTNAPEADKLLTKTYRKGFEVAAAA